jgi:hypothetical protein
MCQQLPSRLGSLPVAAPHDGKPLAGAEYLVGIGFRCWLAGFEKGDIQSWAAGWDHYAARLGAEEARYVVTELACWVRAVMTHAARPIETCPVNCGSICRDECMAVAIIAASQHRPCPVLKACVAALIGGDDGGEVAGAAERFARALAGAGIVLERQAPAVVNTAT